MEGSSSSFGSEGGAAAPLATWEKHTKGIGSKLLQKFGFKGRLGAKEDGISTAIEVQVRPTNVGLGFGTSEPTKEKNHKDVKEKKKKSASLFGLEELEQDWKTLNDSTLSKKGTDGIEIQDKKRRKFTTEAFLKDYEEFMGKSSTTTVGPIIDMRQQDIKIINDLNDLSNIEGEETTALTMASLDSKPKYAQELLYTLAKQFEIDAKRSHQEELARRRYEERLEELQQKRQEEEMRLKRLEKARALMLDIHQLAENGGESDGSGIGNIEQVLHIVKVLYQECPQEFYTFGVTKILPSLVEKLVVPLTDSLLSNPLSVMIVYKQWQEMSIYFQEQGVRSIAGEFTNAFQLIADREFLPIVRRFISSQWNPVTQCTQCVDVIDVMTKILPGQTIQDLIDVVLLPRLSAALNAWNNDMDHPIHTWILPWLPLLTSKLSSLYPDVRRKLLSWLRNWHAHQPSAIAVVSPWLQVFDTACMENFLSKVIIPKLIDYIRRDFSVNPANQSLEVIEVLLKWETVLPINQYACIFAGEILPKWLRALIAWLNVPDCDFEEICVWYEGWQSVFPKSILNNEENVLPLLKFALDVMKEVASRRVTNRSTSTQQSSAIDLSVVYKSALQCVERSDYYELMRKHMVDRKFKENIDHIQKDQSDRGASSFTASLRDVMAMMAEKNNLNFQPKLGRNVEGKQIWEFGKTSCYIENSVIYSFRPANGTWLPISLDDLVLTQSL